MQQPDFRAQLEIFRDRSVQIGAAAGLIAGLILGWFVLGWWLAPVQWVDARPGDLHPAWQKHYVAMVVDSYRVSGDAQTARARLQGFDATRLGILFGQVEEDFRQQGAGGQAEGTRQLADLLGISIERPGSAAAPATLPAPRPTVAGTGQPGILPRMALPRWALVCGTVLLAMLIVVGAVAAAIWYQRRSMQFEGEVRDSKEGAVRARRQPRIESMSLGERVTIQYDRDGPHYEQTVQIYRGDEMVGSFGLRGVTTLSDGERVVACSAWLYEPRVPERSADTCVLVSPRVFQNQALRASLSHDREPGEVIAAASGEMARLEHETLELTLRVIDAEYDDSDDRYISRLIIDLEPATKRRRADGPAPFDIS